MMYTDESPFHQDPRVGLGALWINRNCLWALWLKMALNMGHAVTLNCVDIQPNPIFAHLRSSLLLTHFRLQSYLPRSPNYCLCISGHVSHRRLYGAKLSESRHTIVFVYILLTLLKTGGKSSGCSPRPPFIVCWWWQLPASLQRAWPDVPRFKKKRKKEKNLVPTVTVHARAFFFQNTKSHRDCLNLKKKQKTSNCPA